MYYCLNNFITVSKDFGLCSIYNCISNSHLLGDEIAYIFLSALSYSPISINVASETILKNFRNAELNQVINDASEYYDSLVTAGILSKGQTKEECLANRLSFSYEHQNEINERFRIFNEVDEDVLAKIKPQRELRLKSLHIELTSKCNERCIHCYIPHDQKTTDMSIDTFNKLFEEIQSVGIESVTLSGGECMLHPLFLDILKRFKAENIHVTLLSNLTLLSQDIIDVLSMGLLSSVQVSLFSLDEKVHDKITQKKGSWRITMMNIESVMETNFLPVRPDMDLAEMVKVISKSTRNLFPVVEANGVLIGIVVLDDIRHFMFRQELYHRFYVDKFMRKPQERIYTNDSMEEVMHKFDKTGAWNLPVVDENNKYKGFVSKSKMLNTYRQVLVDFSAE